MSIAPCPSHDELIEFSVGRLSDERSEEIGRHLDQCELCQGVLADLPECGAP